MINELDQNILFELALTPDIEFHLQRHTIITWKESNDISDDDRAISFQDLDGVREVWERLRRIRGNFDNDDEYLYDKDFDSYENIAELLKGPLMGVEEQNFDDTDFYLPTPSVENLAFIDKELNSDIDSSKVGKINEELTKDDFEYMRQLGDVFYAAEKENDLVSLREIFYIFKSLFLIASRDLIEKLMSDEFYLMVFGALEYDPESNGNRTMHRKYFSEVAIFNNILNIQNKELLDKIHINHRLTYLKDTAIGRFIEEMPSFNISLILQTNNSFIIQFFFDNTEYIEKMLKLLKETKEEETAKKILMFFNEIINCIKDLQQKRPKFSELIIKLGVFDSFEVCLGFHNKTINSLILQILIEILNCVPLIFKEAIKKNCQDNENSNLLNLLTDLFLNYDDFGIKYEISNVIKSLIDNEISDDIKSKNNLFTIIFENVLVKFSDVLLKHESKDASTKQIIIELLCYSINQHGTKTIQYWIIHNNILEKVLSVVKDGSKILDLQIIKFIKCIILKFDYTFFKLIGETKCFDVVKLLYEKNLKKSNAINSAISELMSLLKAPNLKKLITYLVENYGDFVDKYFSDIKTYLSKPKEEMSLGAVNGNGYENDFTFEGLFAKQNEEEVNFDNVPSYLGNKRNTEDEFF